MKKNISLLILAFLFMLIASCSEQATDPPDNQPTSKWEKVSDLPGNYLHLKTKGNSIYAVCYNAGYKFAVSQDNGKNWQVSDLNFIPRDNGFLSIEGNTFFISSVDGLFKSKDNGATWAEDLYLRNFVGTSYGIPTLTNMYVESERIYLGQVKTANMPMHVHGIFYSSDNGETWSCPAPTPHRVVALYKVENILVFCNQIIFFSVDNLNTWFEATGGNGEVYEFLRDGSRLYAISYSFIKYSDSKGVLWNDCSPVFAKDVFGLYLTFTFTDDKLFITDSKGLIHYTSKANIDWKVLDAELPAFDPFPYENQTMFAMGNDYLYYVSNDKLWRMKIDF
jgi:hypothetical protein